MPRRAEYELSCRRRYPHCFALDDRRPVPTVIYPRSAKNRISEGDGYVRQARDATSRGVARLIKDRLLEEQAQQ